MIVNWGYVGGFFDGEGTMHIDGSSCRAEMYQNDLITLENIQAFLRQEGINSTIYDRRKHTKVWVLFVNAARANANLFMQKILPYVQRKRTVVQDGLRYQKLFPVLPSGPRP